MFNDYYVYHCFIKETGEIFYVGVGEGDSSIVDRSTYLEIQNIQKRYNTETKIIYKNLTKKEAYDKQYEEITRIIIETKDVLVNRRIPYKLKNSNFYNKDKVLEYKKEEAPVIYSTEIDRRYYDLEHRLFDRIEEKNLSKVAIKDMTISKEELKIVYSGKFDKYYKEVIELLEKNSSRILKSRYPNSVTAWIYVGDKYIRDFNTEREVEIRKIGREVPVYHLIDVWKFLKNKFNYEENISNELEKIEVNPINARRTLDKIKHRKTARGVGSKCWYLGELERKLGHFYPAIEYFDEARENGYYFPELYESYVKVYKKLGDLDNEIDILNEAIQIFSKDKKQYSKSIMLFHSQRIKAIKKLKKNLKK